MLNAIHQNNLVDVWRFRLISSLGFMARALLILVCGTFLLAATTFTTNAAQNSDQIEIIVNKQLTMDQIPLRDLRAIYSMKKRYWEESLPITVYVLANDNAVHREFCKKRLNVFPNQLESIWYRQVYTGTGSAPIALSDIDEMIDYIASTPGAIGYVDYKNLEKIYNNENIKILSIK